MPARGGGTHPLPSAWQPVFDYFMECVRSNALVKAYTDEKHSLVSTLDTTWPALYLKETLVMPPAYGIVTCMAMSREFCYFNAEYIERVALHMKASPPAMAPLES